VFVASCTNDGCNVSAKDTELKPVSCDDGYGTNAFLLTGSQILAVRAAVIPRSGTVQFDDAEPSHPLACTTNDGCLSSLFTSYTCQNGLCQSISTTTPLTTSDVITLCQADLPWPTTCPYLTDPMFAARMVQVAASCGSQSNCSNVPAACRQPIPVAPDPDA
jgi:hypothetical protein